MESLQDKSQSLTERINRLQGEMEQNNQTLAQKKAKNLTDKTIEELEAEQKPMKSNKLMFGKRWATFFMNFEAMMKQEKRAKII